MNRYEAESIDEDLVRQDEELAARHGKNVSLLVAACRLMVTFDFESYRTKHGYQAAIKKWTEIKRAARRALNGVTL